MFREQGIKDFILCRDNAEPPSEMEDCDFAVVRMAGDAKLDFTTRPVEVTGTFSLLPTPSGEGKRRLLYKIVATKAERL